MSRDAKGNQGMEGHGNEGLTRRRFLAGGAAIAAAGAGVPLLGRNERALAAETEGFFDATSTFFSTAFVEYSDSLDTDSDGDLWPSCWADDGDLYAANGDGRGFSDQPFADVVMNRIFGSPETGITGERLAAGDEIANIWANPNQYNRKPTGMVAVDGDGDGQDELYVAVQDLRKPAEGGDARTGPFDEAPNASISKSVDYGQTWQKTNEPMFTDYRFTTIMFLDYGQSQENARVLGSEGASYVYAYGMDYNWRDSFSNVVADPTRLYLARIPRSSIQDRSTWEFFSGTRPNGNPTWNPRIDQRVPVLQDERRVYPTLRRPDDPKNMTVISQGSVVYNAPLDRYIYTSWTEYTFEFYEAPQPWGPWKLFMRKDFGGNPWFGRTATPENSRSINSQSATNRPSKSVKFGPSKSSRSSLAADSGCPGPKNGGYATVVPSKFISEDGKTMWVQANWFVGIACGEPNYNFSFRKFEVEPFTRSMARNRPDPANNLAITGEGTTPIEKSAHFGNGNYYNDGVKNQSEDSFDWANKRLDFWGYTWSREYNFDRVVYTTGEMFSDGGWFRSRGDGLRVQVHQDFEWVDVGGLSISPEYPYDRTAGPNKTYTLTFRDVRGNGVRIIGPPGGNSYFTSIGELEVYYDDRSRRGPPAGVPGPPEGVPGPPANPGRRA